MEIQGNQLVLYVEGEPVVACTEPCMVFPDGESMEENILRTCKEYTLTVNGHLPEIELTPIQEWHYQWHRSKELPRKAKKDYRKKLLKMLQ